MLAMSGCPNNEEIKNDWYKTASEVGFVKEKVIPKRMDYLVQKIY